MSELEFEELLKELEDTSNSDWEGLDDVLALVPGALERLKGMEGEIEKWDYWAELFMIHEKMEEIKKGGELPN